MDLKVMPFPGAVEMMRFTVVRRTSATPVYNIGVASRLTGIPIHTLRWIESHGLVCPHRTEGNQRLFSEEDLSLLARVRSLMEQDVNLPGIRIILRITQGQGMSEPPPARGPRKASSNGAESHRRTVKRE